MTTRINLFTKRLPNILADETLTQKASLNAIASILDYGARWVVTFLINPLLVSGLGDLGYGIWQVLSRSVVYINPAGGRPTQALKWVIANQQSSTDYEEKRRQVGSAVAVWLLFLPVLSIFGAILAWFIPNWLDVPLELYPSVRLATALLVANLIFTNLAEIPQSVLRGENLIYKRMGMTTLFVFLGGGLMALAVFLDSGLIGIAVANLITTALTGALFFILVRSYVQWFGIAKPVFSAVRKFLGLSWWFLTWSMVAQFFKAGDVVILGIFDSAELVTTYSLTRYIPEIIIGFVAVVVWGITPGLGGIIGKGDVSKASRVRGEIMLFTWLIVTVFGSTMLLWNRSFVMLWIGGEYYAGSISNLLIIMMVSQFVFIRNDANIIDLTLDLKSKVLYGLLSVGFTAGVSTLLVGVFELGIVGLTLGFIAGQLILTVRYPLIMGNFLGVSISTQLRGIIRPVVVTIMFFVLLSVLGNYMIANTWISLVLSAGTTVGLLSLMSFYLGMTREQRNGLLNRVQKVLPNF